MCNMNMAVLASASILHDAGSAHTVTLRDNYITDASQPFSRHCRIQTINHIVPSPLPATSKPPLPREGGEKFKQQGGIMSRPTSFSPDVCQRPSCSSVLEQDTQFLPVKKKRNYFFPIFYSPTGGNTLLE